MSISTNFLKENLIYVSIFCYCNSSYCLTYHRISVGCKHFIYKKIYRSYKIENKVKIFSLKIHTEYGWSNNNLMSLFHIKEIIYQCQSKLLCLFYSFLQTCNNDQRKQVILILYTTKHSVVCLQDPLVLQTTSSDVMNLLKA